MERLKTLAERIRLVVEQNAELRGAQNWSLDAGLSRAHISSFYDRAKKEPAASMSADAIAKLADTAKVNRLWLAFGEGPMVGSLDPETDARRWFLHRVEHEGLGTEAEALAWLEQYKEPYTRPIPWNNQAFLAYKRHVEGATVHRLAPAEPTTTRDADLADPRRVAIASLREEYAGNVNALAWLDQHKAAFAGPELEWLPKLQTELKAFLKGKTTESRKPLDAEEQRQKERTERILNRPRKKP